MRHAGTFGSVFDGGGLSGRRSGQSELGQTEVQDFGVAALGDEDVCRLDVAVHDAFGVRGVQRIGKFNRKGEQDFNLDGIAVDAVLERLPIEVFHGDETLAVVFANFVDGADVRVI